MGDPEQPEGDHGVVDVIEETGLTSEDLQVPPVQPTHRPDPMKKLFTPEAVDIDSLRVVCEERLQALTDTFGPEDHRVRHAERRIHEYIETIPVEGAAWTFAAAYLNWACKFPEDIVQDHASQSCSCPGGAGWIEEDDGAGNTWRPCLRCNRNAYEQMVARANGTSGRVGAEPDPFEDD